VSAIEGKKYLSASRKGASAPLSEEGLNDVPKYTEKEMERMRYQLIKQVTISFKWIV